MMTAKKPPKICPSCGEEGSMFLIGSEFVCTDPNCGKAIPLYPDKGPGYKPPSKRKKPASK